MSANTAPADQGKAVTEEKVFPPIARVDRVMGVLHLARQMSLRGMETRATVHDWAHMDCSLWLVLDELQSLRNDLEGLGHV